MPATPYATLEQVRALNTGRTIGATSKPSATQVQNFLSNAAAIIDAKLRSEGYALPVPTGATSALEVLEYANAAGGHYFTEEAAPTSEKLKSAKEMWESALKMLSSVELPTDQDPEQTLARFPSAATPYFTRDLEL